MGFDVDSTFNMLCKEGEFDCKKPSQWKIKYPRDGSRGREEL